MGLGSSLIYAPADYASTEELIELCKVVSEYKGMYITHMRSESDKICPPHRIGSPWVRSCDDFLGKSLQGLL